MSLPPPEATRLVFITDKRALSPTALAMWSALRHARRPVEVVFVGLGLDDVDQGRVSQVAAGFSGSSLRHVPFDTSLLGGLTTPGAHISPATYARLFLHRYLGGRVLYLDGDVLVTGDLTDIDEVIPAGTLAAGANDIGAVQWWARKRQGDDRPSGWLRLGEANAGYVNAGVLWLNLDALRNEPDLTTAFEDAERAASCKLADQDHVNHVLAGRIVLLGPEWNCSWGQIARQRRAVALGGVTVVGAAGGVRVIRYHGPAKPWLPQQWSTRTRRRYSQILRYRWTKLRFNRRFPALAF